MKVTREVLRERLGEARAVLEEARQHSEAHANILDESRWQGMLDEARADIDDLDMLSVAFGLMTAAGMLAGAHGMYEEADDPMAQTYGRLVMPFAEMVATGLMFVATRIGDEEVALPQLEQLFGDANLDAEELTPAHGLVDPDCRSNKHAACIGGPCACDCHGEA